MKTLMLTVDSDKSYYERSNLTDPKENQIFKRKIMS